MHIVFGTEGGTHLTSGRFVPVCLFYIVERARVPVVVSQLYSKQTGSGLHPPTVVLHRASVHGFE